MSLSFNNQEKSFLFPVLPEQIEISDGQNSKTYTTEGLGEINVIKAPKLTTYKFESEFPGQPYPYVDMPHYLKKPEEYVKDITHWMSLKRPVRFIYKGKSFDINEAVSIDSFEWKEVAGSPGDIEFSLTLRKYVFYAARKVILGKAPATGGTPVLQKAAPQRPNERERPKTVTSGPLDSAWKVVKKLFGDESRYKDFQKVNGLTDAQMIQLPADKTLQVPK